METGAWPKVSSDRLVKPGIEPATPGLQGKWHIHYTMAAPWSQSEQTFLIVTYHLYPCCAEYFYKLHCSQNIPLIPIAGKKT